MPELIIKRELLLVLLLWAESFVLVASFSKEVVCVSWSIVSGDWGTRLE